MRSMIRWTVLAAMTLSFGAAACGGKASEETCKAAFANQTKLAIDAALAGMPDATDDIKKQTTETTTKAMAGQEEGFLKGCMEAPSAPIKCMAEAKDMKAFAECAAVK